VRPALLVALVLAAAPATAAAEQRAPRDFVALDRYAPAILHDIRYFSDHNFVGRPIRGYRRPLCLLTRDTARALRRAQRRLRGRGLTLKVYDCYRPQRAVDDFVRWARDRDATEMRRELYPRVAKHRLFADGYIAQRSGHSRGSTVDLTLVRRPAAAQPDWRPGAFGRCFDADRFPDNSVDMGTGYDCFDTLAATLDPRIDGVPRRNRLLLKRTLEAVGFVNYAKEWWHFTLSEETYPRRHFDFPVRRRSLRR
jgi:D-alanyl-D-alanine dipeptidase